MKNILKGLKLLEHSSVLAGPSAEMFFAEPGVKVNKIKNLKTIGDVTISWKQSQENPKDYKKNYLCTKRHI
ncbi:MAG: hypothetical protein WAR79_18320 [Melioribacteraceae bacterium]